MSTMGRDADEQARCEREETQNLFSTDSRLVVRCAADIKPEKVDRLWEQRLPLGKCVLVAGEGGLDKSMVWPGSLLLAEFEKKIAELGDALLVIIDPITSYLGRVDSHKNAELRSVLEPLGKMAARLRVTVIANTHLSKASVGSANSRVIGSVAFVNHSR